MQLVGKHGDKEEHHFSTMERGSIHICLFWKQLSTLCFIVGYVYIIWLTEILFTLHPCSDQ